MASITRIPAGHNRGGLSSCNSDHHDGNIREPPSQEELACNPSYQSLSPVV